MHAKLQDRDRITYRYCLQWSVENERTTEAKFKCDISLTPRDGLRTLHDSRRRKGLAGGAAVTLGGVGGVSDVPRLLRSCRDWEGPKVGHVIRFEGGIGSLSGEITKRKYAKKTKLCKEEDR